jgi:hypothetical protein
MPWPFHRQISDLGLITLGYVSEIRIPRVTDPAPDHGAAPRPARVGQGRACAAVHSGANDARYARGGFGSKRSRTLAFTREPSEASGGSP